MKNDIDFDELDKAVNSLMGGVKPGESDEETPAQKTLAISPTLGPDEKPAYNKLDEVAKKIGSETLVPGGERTIVEDLDTVAPPAAAPIPVKPLTIAPRPPIGRFMDVVHPSSDMRTNTAAVQPSVAVTPAAAPLPQPQPVVQEVAKPDTSTSQRTTIPEAASLTPFLPDAKVEKRPLGGQISSNVTDTVPETTSINSEPVETSDNTQKVLDATTIQGETSAELQSIESTPVTNVPDHMQESVRSVESVDTEQLTSPSGPAGHDAPAADGAIYDVNNFHQPLDHPAKRKSGWGVVVIILIIIIVSGALGAAAYFLLGYGI